MGYLLAIEIEAYLLMVKPSGVAFTFRISAIVNSSMVVDILRLFKLFQTSGGVYTCFSLQTQYVNKPSHYAAKRR